MVASPDWEDRPEQEWTLAIEQAVRSVACATPWITDAELTSLGIRFASPACYPWIEGAAEAELKTLLALGATKTCQTCEASFAQAEDGDKRCPLCGERA